MSDQKAFRLVQEEGYRERVLMEGDTIEEILESAAEKSGRGDLWEAIDDL